jgi:hypothetical protein
MLRRMLIALVVLVLSTLTFARTIPCRHDCSVKVVTFTEIPNFEGGNSVGFEALLFDPSYFSAPLTLSKVRLRSRVILQQLDRL